VHEILQARSTLQAWLLGQNAAIDRDQLVAYACIVAWVEHFPAAASDLDRELALSSCAIARVEPDRFYKQRRMALGRLAKWYQSALL